MAKPSTNSLQKDIEALQKEVKELRTLLIFKASAEHNHRFDEVEGLHDSFKRLLEVMETKDHEHDISEINGANAVIQNAVNKAVGEIKAPKTLTVEDVRTIIYDVLPTINKEIVTVNNTNSESSEDSKPLTPSSIKPRLAVKIDSAVQTEKASQVTIRIINDFDYCVSNSRIVVSYKCKDKNSYEFLETKNVTSDTQVYLIPTSLNVESLQVRLVDNNNPKALIQQTIRMG